MIEEFSSIDQLDPLSHDWARLLAVTPGATFFHSLPWLKTYWKHYGDGQLLKVLIVRQGDEITGIVPLVIRQETTRLGTLRYLTYPLDYWGSFYGPIGSDPHALLTECLEYLGRRQRQWDLVDLRWIGGYDEAADQFEQTLASAGQRPLKRLLDQSAVIDLPGSWDAYLASRTSKWRNNLKRWRRRADELGKITYQRFRPVGGTVSNQCHELFDQCAAIAESSWQNSSPDGTTLSSESVQAFLRDMHATAAAHGSLDLNLMYLDGKPIAFGYNYYFDGRIFGLRVGYDPSVGNGGVGNLLYALMIEDACNRGDTLFDLGPGSLDCKRQIWTRVLPIYRLTCYRRFSISQQLMRMKHQREASQQQAELVGAK